jgi:ABC-type phosphate transport system permease subunit
MKSRSWKHHAPKYQSAIPVILSTHHLTGQVANVVSVPGEIRMATGMNESMKEWTTLGKPWLEMLNPILELHSGWGFLPG